jgi:hypothetical protein
VEEYKFRVEREKRESERKKIEAEGIRDFQQTVSQGISESYLRWRGIEATLQLSQSTNAKVVVIGSGKDGLPIILGNVEYPGAARRKHAAERERHQQGKHRCRSGGAVGENASYQIGDPDRKDRACQLGYSVYYSRGIALVLANQLANQPI